MDTSSGNERHLYIERDKTGTSCPHAAMRRSLGWHVRFNADLMGHPTGKRAKQDNPAFATYGPE